MEDDEVSQSLCLGSSHYMNKTLTKVVEQQSFLRPRGHSSRRQTLGQKFSGSGGWIRYFHSYSTAHLLTFFLPIVTDSSIVFHPIRSTITHGINKYPLQHKRDRVLGKGRWTEQSHRRREKKKGARERRSKTREWQEKTEDQRSEAEGSVPVVGEYVRHIRDDATMKRTIFLLLYERKRAPLSDSMWSKKQAYS